MHLPYEEVEVLIRREKSLVTLCKAILSISFLTSLASLIYLSLYHTYTVCITLIALALLLAIPFYILIGREKKRLQSINIGLEVYRMQGVLDLKRQDRLKNGDLYICTIGNFKLPELIFSGINPDPFVVLRPYIGQPMIAEYIPEISKNRRIYDTTGNGYDFIFRHTSNLLPESQLR